ncbi:MAG: energy-coupling factor transporter transmembrane protein EcfT [Anaerolineae bacterium]|nr:energy-coupling factor transporter transmembrane protein EcfT [Anaerolineae bacterium]
MTQTGVFTLNTVESGWLYRLDPRVKLIFAFCWLILCIVMSNVAGLAVLLLSTQVILLTGGLPLKKIGETWKTLAFLILIILIVQPLFSPGSGPVMFQVGTIQISQSGVLLGLSYGLRIAAAAFTALVPVLTTPADRLVLAFQKFGMPYPWAMIFVLAIHALGTIRRLYTTITEAQQTRGWDTSKGNVIKRVKATFPTLIALIVASLRLSDSLSLGLAARGFGIASNASAPRRRTILHDIHMQPVDWYVAAIIVLAFAASIILIVH